MILWNADFADFIAVTVTPSALATVQSACQLFWINTPVRGQAVADPYLINPTSLGGRFLVTNHFVKEMYVITDADLKLKPQSTASAQRGIAMVNFPTYFLARVSSSSG